MSRYQNNIQTWNTLADAYQQKFMDLDLYNDTYNRFLELLPKPDARIFEIGCGPGNITRYLLAQNPALQITATDVAPAMLQLAKNNAPEANFMLLDARETSTVKEQFDGIVCGFCLPYLAKEDCRKLIADCARLLPAEGIFYLSTLEGNYQRSGYQTGSNDSCTCTRKIICSSF